VKIPVTKLVFLDLDGVMNSTASAKRLGTYQRFGEEHVAALNRILSQTGAKVVILSTWRFGKTDLQLWHILKENGVKCEVVGSVSRHGDEEARGLLVKKWLHDYQEGSIDLNDEKPYRPPHKERVSFVILDDDKNLVPFTDRHVQTDPAVGLTEADANRAILMLKEVTW